VVGPEAPLVDGLVDALRAAAVPCFGPVREAARLEGSKLFAKEMMAAAGVPTGGHWVVRTVAEGLDAIDSYPAVIKADGLAAGKGVVIAQNAAEARAALVAMLEERRFGDHPVLVEELLVGDELSVLALCDGERAIPLAPARDFKRIGDGDTGPNTGGMGAFSPVEEIGPELLAEIVATVHQPVLDEMRARGNPFQGVLYAGLMLTEDGPKIVEYNVRFGDPEAQVVMPLFESDPAELLLEAAEGKVRSEPAFSSDAAVTVVCAAEGYPASPRAGDPVEGIAGAEAIDGVIVFCAGVGRAGNDLITAGGRVLDVTAIAPTVSEARRRVYEAVSHISWPGMHHRTDIAARGVL